MAISRITSQDATAIASTSTVTANYPAQPTQWNLLIAAVVASTSAALTSIPGFTAGSARNFVGVTNTVSIWWKIAGANEPTAVVANGTDATVMHLQIFEYQGNNSSAPFDRNTSGTDGGTAITSVNTGNTATTTQADEMAFTATGTNNSHGGFVSFSNSYLALISSTNRLMTGNKILTATGVETVTSTWTTARRAGACLVTFKAYTDQSVTSGTIASTTIFYAPTITTSYTLTLNHLASTTQIYAPTLESVHSIILLEGTGMRDQSVIGVKRGKALRGSGPEVL